MNPQVISGVMWPVRGNPQLKNPTSAFSYETVFITAQYSSYVDICAIFWIYWHWRGEKYTAPIGGLRSFHSYILLPSTHL